MLIRIYFFLLLISICLSQELPTLYEYYTNGGIKSGLVADGDKFHLNGKEISIFSGSLHPFRVHQNRWKETLLKFKAAGLNAVQLYTPWNLHEETPGHFDFETGMLNLTQFLTLIKETDMFAMFRPGPYICAEYEFGGFPAWLLRDPNMKLRSNYKPYLEAVDKYWSKLLAIAKNFQFSTNGGPIIAMQIENEFSSYGNTVNNANDADYLKQLETIARKYGMKELIFTSDPSPTKSGTLPELLQTVNFGGNALQNLKAVKAMQQNKPLYVAEFWSGWFDDWKGKHNKRSADDYAKQYSDIIIQMNSSVNIYMFIGGTNFGWESSYNQVTSYDYDAPLSESGNYTEKYYKTKEIIEKFTNDRKVQKFRKLDPPKVEVAAHYGVVKVTEQLPLNELVKHLKAYTVETPIHSELLNIGDNYGQNFGFTLYRTTIPKSKTFAIKKGEEVRDRGFVVIDDNQIRDIYPGPNVINIDLNSNVFTKSGDDHTLDLLVENLGREKIGGVLNNQRKWLSVDVYIDDKVHKNWQMFALDFNKDLIKGVKTDKWTPIQQYKSPTLYRAKLEIKDEPKDTYLRLDGWHTTNVFINDFNIGRYWNNGPPKTLYVPAPLLKKGVNEIMLFETYGSGTQIEFVDKPILE